MAKDIETRPFKLVLRTGNEHTGRSRPPRGFRFRRGGGRRKRRKTDTERRRSKRRGILKRLQDIEKVPRVDRPVAALGEAAREVAAVLRRVDTAPKRS